jgi:hypothetical protein
MRWAEHMARIGKKRNTEMVFVGKPKRDNLYNLGLDRKAILNCILKKRDGMSWTGFTAFAYGQLAAHCKDSPARVLLPT